MMTSAHAHNHGAACSCQHHPAPQTLERGGLGAAAHAVLSVGIRPCSGALVVLVFALAQGIFWAGIASTFLMALGTAITVAALAALAVGAKDVALRLDARRRTPLGGGHARPGDRRGAVDHRARRGALRRLALRLGRRKRDRLPEPADAKLDVVET